MSGNTTHFSMSLALAHSGDVSAAGLIIGSFIIGACVGRLVADAAGPYEVVVVLSIEILIFAVAIVLAANGHEHPALTLVALAMGVMRWLAGTLPATRALRQVRATRSSRLSRAQQ